MFLQDNAGLLIKPGSEINNDLLPWRKGILIDRIRRTSVESKSIITENVLIEPTEIGDLITVTQEDLEKAKQIINQVLAKKMKKGDIMSLNEDDKNEIVGEVTNKLTKLYTKKVNNKSLAKDILNKVLTRTMEKEQIVQPSKDKQKEETFITKAQMVIENKKQKETSKVSKEIIEQNKTKLIKQAIKSEDKILIDQTQYYFGEQENDNYEIVPDEYKPKLKTENIENIETKSQHNVTLDYTTRPWLKTPNVSTTHEIIENSQKHENISKHENDTSNEYFNKKEQTKKITPWTEQNISLKTPEKSKINENITTITNNSKSQKENIKNVQETKEPRDKTTSIPWTEEIVNLKKTKTQKQPLAKEKIEEVTLKPFKKPVAEDITVTEETPETETTEVVETVVEKSKKRRVKKTRSDGKEEVIETEEPELPEEIKLKPIPIKKPLDDNKINDDKIEKPKPLTNDSPKIDIKSKSKKSPLPKTVSVDSPLRDLEIVSIKRSEEIPEHKAAESEIVAPYFIEKVQPLVAEHEKPTAFTCSVGGVPSPEVKWYRDDRELQTTDVYEIIVYENTSTLRISKPTEEQAGVYVCQATNSAGISTCTALLVVLDSEEVGEAPTFVEPIKPRKVRGKKSIELRCIVKGIPIPEIIWCRENEEIISDENEYTTSFDSKTGEATLTLINPMDVDRSTYLAKAVNIHGKSECMAHITFEKEEYGEAPKFVERLKPKVVKANETTELTCLVKGIPSPSVVWCRDDEEIIPDESHSLIYIPETGESKLIILHPDDIDESTYTVNATNKFGRAECRANLIVQKDELGEAPTFVQPVKPIIAKSNEITELKCTVRGTPNPLVIWCRGNEEIIPDESHLVTYHQETGESILTILNPSEIDETIYTVNAVNKYGQAQCRANLIIQKDESGEAPMFVEPIKPKIAKANTSTELNCLVRGIPTPTVVWFRGEVEIIPDNTHSITFIPETGESKLIISKATEVDQNTYTVKATNKYGRAQCRANVIIQEDVFGVAPTFVEPIKPVLAKPDQTTVLRCLVTGNPVPTLVWCRGKDEIVPDDLHTIQFIPETGESTLTIEKPTTIDEAHYSVEAINKFGRARCRANLVLEKYDTGIAPAFVVPIKPKAAKPTETVELSCVVSGTPTPIVVWCRGDEQIVPDDSHVISYIPETGESKLTICNATELDVNDYTVKAVNDFGVAQCRANLIIDEVVEEIPKPLEEEAPSITKPLQPIIAKKDSCVTLDVHFRGTPELKVRWLHNGKDITDKKTFMRTLTITETTTVIIIKKITKKTSGRYEVVVTNNRGEAKTSTTVLIEDEEDVEETIEKEVATTGKAPYFETELQTETVWEEEEEEEEEEKITTICLIVKVKGTPKPKTRWYESGIEITPNEEFKIEEHDEGVSVLTIKKRPTESAREITCEATNEHGTVTTRTLVIPGIKGTKAYRKPSWVTQMEELREQLQAFQSVPSFVNELKDERAIENETIVFECQFSGNPTPVIIWYRDDKIVRNSSNIQVKITDTKTTLTIKKVTKEDEGVYICKANSNLGEAKNKAKLYVKKLGDETFTATEEEVEEKELEEVKKTKKTKKKTIKKKSKKEFESFNEIEIKEPHSITTTKTVEEKPSLPEREPLSTSETISDETVREVPGPEFARAKLSEESALFTALKIRKPTVVNEVDQVLDQVELAEFGPAEYPLRELATIDILTRHGISTEQVIQEYTTGQFPALRTAPAQSAMVHLIEREGYTSLVADVFTKESTIPETVNEVFKAFMTMVELKHSTLEEIITYLTPEDFQISTWDFEHASQITTDDTITDTAEISEPVNVLINEVKNKTRSTKRLTKTINDSLTVENEQVQKNIEESNIKITDITDTTITELSENKPIKTKKVMKRKKEIEDISKREDKEEEEIITKETKIIKINKVEQSSTAEEIIPEEITYEFNIEKYPAICPTVLKTSTYLNETIAQQEAVELSTDINNVPEKAQIRIITRSAAESIITNDEEKEEIRKETIEIKKHKANSAFEFNESFSTDHPDAQSPLEEIVKTFEFIPCLAIKDVIPKESITISEIYPNQSLGKETDYKPKNEEAKVTIISHSQKVVTESIASTKEGEIKQEIMPQKKNARQDYIEHESINVVEVNEAHTESQLLDDFKPTPAKSSVEYPLNEQLVVSESHSEIQPENYYPEIIVPTEVAEQIIVASNNAITAFQIESSEKEAKYNPSKPLNKFKADISIIAEKYIKVSESNIHEKETKLEKENVPEKSFANSDIILQSSLIVNSVNQEENEEKFNTHLPQSHTAKLTINNANKVCSSSVIEINEAESDLKISAIPEMKQIESSILGLEVTEIIPNETESNFTSQSALKILPDTSITENNSCIVTETTVDDYSTELLTNLNYKTFEAKPKFEELEAKQIYQINVQENNIPLNETPKPISAKLETSFSPIKSITVEQTIAAEQEQLLSLRVPQELHNSVSVPSHSLQAVVIEEITPENCVTQLEDTYKDNNQHASKIAQINFVDDQCIIVKEVSTYESETNLSLDSKPGNVKAVPVFTGHDLKNVNITIDEAYGVNITEQPFYEKENETIEQKVFKSKKAITEFVPIEIADRSEIVTGDYTMDLIQPEVSEMHANHQTSTFESVILYETNVSEKEQEMTKDKTPLLCSANKSLILDEAIEITEIISDNRPEDIFISKLPQEKTAKANIIPLKPLVGQDVTTCENVETVKNKSPITGVAQISQKPYHSLETSLIILTDSENKLSDFVMPDTKKADTNYSELDIPINVVEILTQDKELDFTTQETPLHTLDKQEIILEECRVTSQTMVCSSTSDFDEIIPQSVYALSSKSTQMAIESLENAHLEKEGNLVDDHIFSERHADLRYEEIKSIQITEQVKLDTKQELVIEDKPMDKKSNVTIIGQDVAETFETKVESPIEELKIEFPKQKSAKTIQPNEVHIEDNSGTYMVTEIFPKEKEIQLLEKSQPIYRHAEQDILSHEGLQVNETNISICEKELTDFDYSTKLSNQVIEPLEFPQKSEKNTLECAEPLKEIRETVHQASSEHILLEGISTTVVNFQDNEIPFEQSTKSTEKSASLKYEMEQTLGITEVCLGESETNLISVLLPRSHTAISDMTETQQVATSFEVVSQNSTQNLRAQSFPSVISVIPKSTETHGLEVTETMYQESETPFKSVENTSKTCNFTIQMDQNIEITEIVTNESEKTLDIFERNKGLEANIVFDENQSVSIEEIETSDDIVPLSKNVLNPSSATKQLEPLLGIMVTEVRPEEFEIPHETKTKPLLKHVSQILPENQSLNVTSAIIVEKESILNESKKEIQQNAQVSSVYSPMKVVQSEENFIETSLIDLNTTTPNEIFLESSQIPYDSINQMEISPLEKESELKMTKNKKKEVAVINIDTINLLDTTEIITGEKESIYTTLTKPITKQALIDITDSQPVSEAFEVKIEDSISELQVPNVKTCTIIPAQEVLRSVVIIENLGHDKEEIFEGEYKPLLSNANINVEKEKETKTITEVITHEMEGQVKNLDMPSTKNAQIEITSGQEVAKKLEIISDTALGSLKDFVTKSSTAIPIRDTFDSIQSTITITEDKENPFDSNLIYQKSKADINIEESKSINITEVIVEDKEGKYISPKLPETKKAGKSILQNEAAESSIVLADENLRPLDKYKTNEESANIVLETHFNISQTETTVQESEKNLEPVNILSNEAELTMIPNNSLTITEVITDDNGENTTSNVFIPIIDTNHALVSQSELHDTAISTEINTLEKEKLFTKTPKFDNFKAEIKFKEDKSLNVCETVLDYNEMPLKINKVLEKQASLIQSTLDVASISEHTLIESEKNLESTIVPKEQIINISFENNINVQVSEANIIETESDFLTPTQNTETATISELILQPVANVTEIIAGINVQDLPQMCKTEYNIAKASHSTFNSIIQTKLEVSESEGLLEKPKSIEEKASVKADTLENVVITEPEISEKEGIFVDLEKNDLRHAQLSLEEEKSSIIISNVVSEDKESAFTVGPKRKSSIAKITLENLRAITNSEQNVSEKEGTLNIKIPKDETANVTFEDSQSGIVVSNVIPECKEENLKTNNTIYSTATLVTENFESLIQNEQIVNEKEQFTRYETKPKTSNASVSIENAKLGTIISEVICSDRESDFHKTQIGSASKALISTEELKPLITTEAQLLSNVEEMTFPSIVLDKYAKIKLNELNHLTIQELIPKLIPLESHQIQSETRPIPSENQKIVQFTARKGVSQINNSIKVNEDIVLESADNLRQEQIDQQRATITDIQLSTDDILPALHGEQIITTETQTQKQIKHTQQHKRQLDKLPQKEDTMPISKIRSDKSETTTIIPDRATLINIKTTTVIEGGKKKVTKKKTIKTVKDGVENVEVIESKPEITELDDEETKPLPEIESVKPEEATLIPDEAT
ncbi:titin-like, partial [Melanaphis sacchari]|uniref:titin-like n=1 Tax=Melanaphis sacchari TaxID=742174 RepID=UPI000DC15056